MSMVLALTSERLELSKIAITGEPCEPENSLQPQTSGLPEPPDLLTYEMGMRIPDPRIMNKPEILCSL